MLIKLVLQMKLYKIYVELAKSCPNRRLGRYWGLVSNQPGKRFCRLVFDSHMHCLIVAISGWVFALPAEYIRLLFSHSAPFHAINIWFIFFHAFYHSCMMNLLGRMTVHDESSWFESQVMLNTLIKWSQLTHRLWIRGATEPSQVE